MSGFCLAIARSEAIRLTVFLTKAFSHILESLFQILLKVLLDKYPGHVENDALKRLVSLSSFSTIVKLLAASIKISPESKIEFDWKAADSSLSDFTSAAIQPEIVDLSELFEVLT